jgi:hypothetical protein
MPYMDVGIGHFMQMYNVGALCSDNAQEAGAIGKHEKTDMGCSLGLFDSLPDGVFGLVNVQLVTGLQKLQSPCQFALLGIWVIFDNFPIGLGDSILSIVDTGCLCHRVRGTREQGRSSRLYRRLSFETKIVKTQEGWHWSPATTARVTLLRGQRLPYIETAQAARAAQEWFMSCLVGELLNSAQNTAQLS